MSRGHGREEALIAYKEKDKARECAKRDSLLWAFALTCELFLLKGLRIPLRSELPDSPSQDRIAIPR